MIHFLLNVLIFVCLATLIIALVWYVIDHIRIKYTQSSQSAKQTMHPPHTTYFYADARSVCVMQSQAVQPDILSIKQSLDECHIGNDHIKRGLLICLLSKNHLLISGHPGTGKTQISKAFASMVDMPYSRIQGTSDLTPADLIGFQYYDRQTQQFVNRRGPLCKNFILIDELNRMTPKTQSALLQAMEEQKLTIDTQTIDLTQPYMLVATINHDEVAGTYTLPQSLADRFALQVSIQPLSAAQELAMLNLGSSGQVANMVVDIPKILGWQTQVSQVMLSVDIQHDILDTIGSLRAYESISARKLKQICSMTQARAWMCGEQKVTQVHVSDILSLITH